MPDKLPADEQPVRSADASTFTASSTLFQNRFTAKSGDRFGPYKILEEIGQGGCGVVFIAEQEEPVRRRVALKIIKLGMDTRQVIARFEAERQALAMMDHPNIAKVLDAGCTDTGRPFFVMELVRGIKITDYCDQNKLSTVERLKLFIQVCHAVQHAHQKGIIHRDLKPSNILVTLQDGVPTPKVIDFGIAKAVANQKLTDKTIYTALEQFVGTPAYMSPEQAEMTGVDVDTRSDIYSLGVLLYELLIGEPPFSSEELLSVGLDAMRRTLREQDPTKPSTKLITMTHADLAAIAKHRQSDPVRLVKLVRGDLDWIVLKTLEKDRNRRYETANELLRDVERHLSNEPVLARPPSRLYEFQKTVRRHKFGFAAAAALMLVLALGILVSTREAVRAIRAEREDGRLRLQAERARAQAEAAQRNETAQRLVAQSNEQKALQEEAKAKRAENLAKERGEETRRNLYAAEMNTANQVLDLMNGIHRISGVVSKWEYQKPDLRGWEWYYLNSLCHRETANLLGHREHVSALSVSADGATLASGSYDGTAKIWDVPTGLEAATFQAGGSNQVTSVAISPDGSHLAVAEPMRLGIWDVRAGKELRTLPVCAQQLGPITSIAWSVDGRRLAVGGGPAMLQVWDAENGRLVKDFKGHQGLVTSVSWSTDGSRLASASRDNTVRIWDPVSGTEVLSPLQHPSWGLGVSWSSDDTMLATGCIDNYARIWDARSGENLRTLRPHAVVVQALAWRPGAKQLASVSNHDMFVHLWGWQENRTLAVLRGHTATLTSLAWSPSGSWLASADNDGIVKIWSPEANGAQTLYDSIQGAPEGLAWSPDGGSLAIGLANGFVSILDAASGKILHTFPTVPYAVNGVAWSPDGTRLAAAIGGEATALVTNVPLVEIRATKIPGSCVAIWDARSGKQISVLSGHTNTVYKVAWSPDSKRLVSASLDRTAKIWDAQTGGELRTLPCKGGQLLGVDWSPDGRRIATGTRSKPGIEIWDSDTGKKLQELPSELTRDVVWSPEGARLASAHDDGTVAIWDAVSGKKQFVFRGHTAGVLWVRWHPDGRRILSMDRETQVKIWDPEDGREMLTLPNYGKSAWSPDGLRLVCLGNKHAAASIVIYDATMGYAASRSDKALPGLNRWLDVHSDDLRYLPRRAEVLAALGEFGKSADDYQRILASVNVKRPRFFETGWRICGPIINEPQAGPPAQANWQPMSRDAARLNFADLIEPIESTNGAVVYAQEWLWTPEEIKLDLAVESETPVQVRLNRQSYEPVPISAHAAVTLAAGWNVLSARIPFSDTNAFLARLSLAR